MIAYRGALRVWPVAAGFTSPSRRDFDFLLIRFTLDGAGLMGGEVFRKKRFFMQIHRWRLAWLLRR